MERSSETLARIASPIIAFVLMAIWGVMSLAHAYNQNLGELNDAVTHGFAVTSYIDAVLSDLDRLNADQRAFLSTGDRRFLQEEGVWKSSVNLQRNMAWLNSLAPANQLPLPVLKRLSRAIGQVLDSVGESYDIRDAHGAATALAFFDSKEAAAAIAKSEAAELKNEIAQRIAVRIGGARGPDVVFEAFFHATRAGLTLRHNSLLASSIRLHVIGPTNRRVATR